MKMKMKKLLFTALGVMMSSVAAAATPVVQGDQNNANNIIAQQGHLAKIEQAGVLKVGMTGDYKPLSFYNQQTEQYEGM